MLGGGCVQEEIRFVICPEMLVSLLLCEVMMPTEAIQLIGCEQYSDYVGYADSFEFGGNFIDRNPRYVVQPSIHRFIDRSSETIGVDEPVESSPWTRCPLPIQPISISRSGSIENCSKRTSDSIRDDPLPLARYP